MKNKLIYGIIFLIVANCSFASEEDFCSGEFKQSILILRNTGSLSESMRFKGGVKAGELEFVPFCIIGNPAMSDGMRYTIISYKNKNAFLVREWNGLTGNKISYGPFESNAYNKAVNERLRLDKALRALPVT